MYSTKKYISEVEGRQDGRGTHHKVRFAQPHEIEVLAGTLLNLRIDAGGILTQHLQDSGTQLVRIQIEHLHVSRQKQRLSWSRRRCELVMDRFKLLKRAMKYFSIRLVLLARWSSLP